jgi:hypothetical protein
LVQMQQQSAAVASGAELVAEHAECVACRRGHDLGVDLYRDGDLAVPQDLHSYAASRRPRWAGRAASSGRLGRAPAAAPARPASGARLAGAKGKDTGPLKP